MIQTERSKNSISKKKKKSERNACLYYIYWKVCNLLIHVEIFILSLCLNKEYLKTIVYREISTFIAYINI